MGPRNLAALVQEVLGEPVEHVSGDVRVALFVSDKSLIEVRVSAPGTEIPPPNWPDIRAKRIYARATAKAPIALFIAMKSDTEVEVFRGNGFGAHPHDMVSCGTFQFSVAATDDPPASSEALLPDPELEVPAPAPTPSGEILERLAQLERTLLQVLAERQPVINVVMPPRAAGRIERDAAGNATRIVPEEP